MEAFDLEGLKKSLLFADIPADSLEQMLPCLGARRKTFCGGETIYHAGQTADALGVVVSGSVQIEHNDYWGNKSIVAGLSAGAVFAESYACIAGEPLLVDVVAVQEAQVLFLNAAKLLRRCGRDCPHHQQLIENLLTVSAHKNLNLSRRIFHTSAKTIRSRVLSYLSFQAEKNGAAEFCIPFDRQQLADYLQVDRSALSHELANMQREHIITVRKNRFTVIAEIER